MRLTRRRFVSLGLTCSMVLIAPLPMWAATESEIDWKMVCRKWMAALLPESSDGLGAESDEVFDVLMRVLDEHPSKRHLLRMASVQISQVPLPQNRKEIDALLSEITTRGKLVHFFYKTFTECYYASSVGWMSIGVTNPPQPSGYMMTVLSEKNRNK